MALRYLAVDLIWIMLRRKNRRRTNSIWFYHQRHVTVASATNPVRILYVAVFADKNTGHRIMVIHLELSRSAVGAQNGDKATDIAECRSL